MKNTLMDCEYDKAVKSVKKLMEDIYCKVCLENGRRYQRINIPDADKFVSAVLYAIGIDY